MRILSLILHNKILSSYLNRPTRNLIPPIKNIKLHLPPHILHPHEIRQRPDRPRQNAPSALMIICVRQLKNEVTPLHGISAAGEDTIAIALDLGVDGLADGGEERLQDDGGEFGGQAEGDEGLGVGDAPFDVVEGGAGEEGQGNNAAGV